MEIFLVVVGTIVVIGLITSLFFNIVILGHLQHQNKQVYGMEVLTKKYIHDQQQMTNLFVQFIYSLNNFTQAIDDFTIAHQDEDLPGGPFPPFPNMDEDHPWKNTFSPDMERRHNLSDEEIKKLSELLREEDEEDDG